MDFAGDKTTCTAIFAGPHNVCVANRPARGSSIRGYGGFVVDRVGIAKLKGGKGLMTISMTAPFEDISSSGDTPTEKYSVDWVQVEKPLISAPIFSAGGANALTDANKVQIQQWEDCPNATVKAAFQFFPDNKNPDPATAIALDANPLVYATKRLKGTDSYSVRLPVLKQTTTTRASSENGQCDVISTPPSEFSATLRASYMWLKTADRSDRTGIHGKWERQEEWTGFDDIDDDLYPAEDA